MEKNRGITLVALVITIIVMLILVGVTISIVLGQNGIIDKASEASERTKQAKINEAKQLTIIEASMNAKETTYKGTLAGVEKEVKIPAGFAVSKVEGENSLDNGLVIIDGNGNEFVWIPCTETEYSTRTSSWASGGYTDKTGWTDTQATGVGLTSVRDNGGFYISRYEAGIPETMTDAYVNTDGATYTTNAKKNVTTYAPVSKQNVQAWNYISQTNSKIVAEKMYNKDGLKSYLVDGYAWNAVCRVIQSKTSKNITNSTTWGNYYNNTTTNYEGLNTLFAMHGYNSGWTIASTYSKGTVIGAPKNSGLNRLELATGASDDFKAYNVYDIAGNMWEWTTENNGTYAVRRGGSFNNYGSSYPAVYSHGGDGVGNCDFNFGFRVVLYM